MIIEFEKKKAVSQDDETTQKAKEKVTLVIQGPYDQMIEKTLSIYSKSEIFEEIIIATWLKDMDRAALAIAHAQTSKGPNILLSVADERFLDQSNAPENVRHQVETRIIGLDKVWTEFCVMQRSDEFYSLQGFVHQLLSPQVKGKILFSNWIVRPFSYHPFHISDHLLGGPTQRFAKALGSLAKRGASNCQYLPASRKQSAYPPESVIGSELFLTYHPRHSQDIGDKEFWKLFMSCFEMYDLDLMADFQVVARRAGVLGCGSLAKLGKLRNPKAMAVDFTHYKKIESLRPMPYWIHRTGTIIRFFARKFVPKIYL